MAFPDTLDPTVPSDTGQVSLGPAQIRAIAQILADVFGLPVSPSTITGAAFGITAAGVVTVSQGDPTGATGVLTKQYFDNRLPINGSATLGAPVLVGLTYTTILSFSMTIPSGASAITVWLLGNMAVSITGISGSPTITFRVQRDGSTIYTSGATTITANLTMEIPAVFVNDTPTTGAHTYTLQAIQTGTATTNVNTPSTWAGFFLGH